MEALILAGGLGTRIRSVIGETPKPLAPISDRPFLFWQMEWLHLLGVRRFILAVGHRSEHLIQTVGESFFGHPVIYSIENQPLGTGGAIFHALDHITDHRILVLNGDSMADAPLQELWNSNADIALAGIEVLDMTRYGALNFDLQTRKLLSFSEKGLHGHGHINAGIYSIHTDYLKNIARPHGFYSFEQDILLPELNHADMQVYPSRGFFIDVGIPADYARAQELIPNFVQETRNLAGFI